MNLKMCAFQFFKWDIGKWDCQIPSFQTHNYYLELNSLVSDTHWGTRSLNTSVGPQPGFLRPLKTEESVANA